MTGKNIYRYLKLNINLQLGVQHEKLIKKDLNISTHYTSQLWIDRRIIVSTIEGDILLAEMSGDYKMMLPSSPGPSFKIKHIVSRKSDGFILVNESGKFKVYQSSAKKDCPYILQEEMPTGIDKEEFWSKRYMKNDSIAPYYIVTGADVAGDYIFYTTENSQILKMKHSAEKREELGKVSYLTSPFHSNSITGLATCLKRQIIVSSSLDKTIRVWSYSPT